MHVPVALDQMADVAVERASLGREHLHEALLDDRRVHPEKLLDRDDQRWVADDSDLFALVSGEPVERPGVWHFPRRASGAGDAATSGASLGLDRLVMILAGANSLREVVLFPAMRK